MARKSRISVKLKRTFGDVGKHLKGKKVYVASFGALAAIGIFSVFAFNTAPKSGENDVENNGMVNMYTVPPNDVSSVSKSEDEKLSQVLNEALNLQNSASPTLMPEFTEAPNKKSDKSIEKLVAPVDGEVIWGYAVDSLIFSRTLSQWMTHSGVDIAAKKGDAVYALLGGCIENVYVDDLLGVSVVLVHDNGMMSVYANLKEEPPVKEGQLVNARDIIGYVGDTAISECMEESHLHFELYKDKLPVDPNEYIRFNKTKIE